eukprot:1147343-Pelagomonas_calceolata.AAC.3
MFSQELPKSFSKAQLLPVQSILSTMRTGGVASCANCVRFLKRLSAEAAAGKKESANPLLLMKDGQADTGASRHWQDSEAVLSLVTDDPKIAKQRSSLQAKLESLQATRNVLSRFA